MKKFLLISCLALLSGCAGGRCLVTAKSVRQPVSFTPCVLDASGKIRTATPQQVVRHIEISKTNWSMLWTAVPLSGRKCDISPEINAKLQETPGDAITNLTVRAQGSNFLHWYIAALAPIIPCYVDVKVQGDIVKLN